MNKINVVVNGKEYQVSYSKKEFAPYDFQVVNLEGERFSLCKEEILNGELLEDLETESYLNYKNFLKSNLDELRSVVKKAETYFLFT